jgi:Glycosyl hydrolases family 15
LIDGEFVLRYEADNLADGHPAGEGAFLACSFWLVDNYILQGRTMEARQLFDRLLSRCNDIGLLAEEFEPRTGRMLGNFPQAFSHVGLINSALNLSRQRGPTEERAGSSTAGAAPSHAGQKGRRPLRGSRSFDRHEGAIAPLPRV